MEEEEEEIVVGDEKAVVDDAYNPALILQLSCGDDDAPGFVSVDSRSRWQRRDSLRKSETSLPYFFSPGPSLTLAISEKTIEQSLPTFEQSLPMATALSASYSDVKVQISARGGDEKERVSPSHRGSEDEEELGGCRKKLRLTKEQSALLEERFKEHASLNPKQKQELAKQLNLMPRQVEVWFQNRRARTKLKQTEVNCEFLKQCCDALTYENRKLKRQLEDLKSLYLVTTSPMYMQLPAATFAVCPCCERAAAGGVDGTKTAVLKAAMEPMVPKKPLFLTLNPFS